MLLPSFQGLCFSFREHIAINEKCVKLFKITGIFGFLL